MKGVNKVILVGHLGKDPEVRVTQSGISIANANIAISERYKKQGEWQEQTEWVRLVFWDKLAEIAEKYLGKGSKIYVEGKLRTRNYEKEGQTHYMTEIHVQDLVMLDGKEQSSGTQRSAFPDTKKQEDNDDDVIF